MTGPFELGSAAGAEVGVAATKAFPISDGWRQTRSSGGSGGRVGFGVVVAPLAPIHEGQIY